MERLTKRLPAGGIELSPKCNPTKFVGFKQRVFKSHEWWNVINRLCELEDLVEGGKEKNE